jgi:glucan 1,3-beta-glucosidase
VRWPAGAETTAAVLLAISAVYILLNETVANWQAVWFAAGLLILAFILRSLQAPAAPG